MISRLQNHFPNNWDKVEYDNALHVLIEISAQSDEYNTVVTPFGDRREEIKKVLRVQHPLAFLNYTLHGEYLSDQGHIDVEEVICYHTVTKRDLYAALDYNCDERRYLYQASKFLTNLDVFVFSPDKITIVINKRTIDDYDKNRYPLYVVLSEEIKSLKYTKL